MQTTPTAAAAAAAAVTVKIISDIVWPFCFIGLRHLQAASQQTNIPVKLSWEPFLLNPQMSPEGQDLEQHLVQKYGPSARQMLQDPNSRLKQMGLAVGIPFNNNRRMLQTIPAHALVEYIKDNISHEKANELMEQLFQRYFVQAQDISQYEILVQAAHDISIDADIVARALAETPDTTILQKDRYAKQHLGVSGVPFFMIYDNTDNNHGNDNHDDSKLPTTFSGAYPVDVIADVLQQAVSASATKK